MRNAGGPLQVNPRSRQNGGSLKGHQFVNCLACCQQDPIFKGHTTLQYSEVWLQPCTVSGSYKISCLWRRVRGEKVVSIRHKFHCMRGSRCHPERRSSAEGKDPSRMYEPCKAVMAACLKTNLLHCLQNRLIRWPANIQTTIRHRKQEVG